MKNKIKVAVITAALMVIGFVLMACDTMGHEPERQPQTPEVMFAWKGELPEAPINPQINWIYYNTEDKTAYIYDGSVWKVLVKDGVDGTDGIDGTSLPIIAEINASGELIINGTVVGIVTGMKGEPGNTPWICEEGFWHIGGTPDECNEDCSGIKATGGQGEPGASGDTPWICDEGFWHIGGIPDECNEDCTGIPATGGQGIKGDKGDQGIPGEPGQPGATPWICVDGFWHIGGTPNACNANCSGIPATFGAIGGLTQLVLTEPDKTNYFACGVNGFDSTGLIVNVVYGSILIPITNYVLIWNEGVISDGNTEIVSESGNKIIYIIDIVGRITEFSIIIAEHDYSEWTTKTAATCLEKEEQEKTCYSCGDYQTREVGEPLGHSYSEGTTKTAATCLEKEVQERTCSSCGDYQTQEVGEPLGHNFVLADREGFEREICQNAGCNETRGERFTFAIGDEGPAGGIIFYVADGKEGRPLGFTVQGYGNPGDEGYYAEYTAYYLEVAPEDIGYQPWAFGQDEDDWSWIDLIPNLSSDWDDETDWAIGRGRMNTAIIIARGIEMGYTTLAAGECAALGTGGKTDWFLPSINELNELFNARWNLNLEDLHDDYFWSSTQGSDNRAWLKDFRNGEPLGYYKNYPSFSVRAIRAF